MTLHFDGPIWYWKGPAPHHFVTVPAPEAKQLRDIQGSVTYGWGMIPVTVRINETEWKTSLFPKDGQFIVPIKAVVRRAENLSEGDWVSLRLDVSPASAMPT
jgi:hypothetical protein